MTNYTSKLSPSYNVISIFETDRSMPIPFSNNKPPPKMAYPAPYKPLLNNNLIVEENSTAMVAVPYRLPEV